MVSLCVESSLVALASELLLGTLLDGIELLVLLQFIQGLTLLFNHVSVREREVIDSFDGLHAQLVILPLVLFVFENLVGLDECICLVHLVFVLIRPLFLHHLALILQQTLLVFALADFLDQLAVLLLVDLVNDLA